MNNNVPNFKRKNFVQGDSPSPTPNESFRDLLESLSNEKRLNQELISSIGFSLRSFTNLDRFLEIIPVVSSRLVGVDGSLLIPFHSDGRISRDQLQGAPRDRLENLIRQISNFKQGNCVGFSTNDAHLKALDLLVNRQFPNASLFSTSISSRGRQRGRLYVFDLKGSFALSDVHRR